MQTFVQCDAIDHVVGVTKDDDIYYLNIYIDCFYSGQESFIHKLLTRLTIISKVIRGKEYLFEEIVLSKESANKLGEALIAS